MVGSSPIKLESHRSNVVLSHRMKGSPSLFVAVTHTAKSDARTGVQTVVRGLIEGFRPHWDVMELVWWNKKSKVLQALDARRRGHLHPALDALKEPRIPRKWLNLFDGTRASCKFPLHLHPFHERGLHRAWLLLPEVMYGPGADEIIAYARHHGMQIAAIFHDAIPVSHPELVRREAAIHHANYMKSLCATDLIVAVSNESGQEFANFARKAKLSAPAIRTCRLADEVVGQEAAAAKKETARDLVNVLCVSTLEPRKNHRILIEAFARASAKLPTMRLHLVGDRHRDAHELADAIANATKKNPNLIWHGKVSPDRLAALYAICDFTVYPSLIEGFGLPVVESIWLGRPCICADWGVMAENSAGGGCVTTDVRDAVKLGERIVQLGSRPELRRELVEELAHRDFRRWRDYANELRSILATQTMT